MFCVVFCAFLNMSLLFFCYVAMLDVFCLLRVVFFIITCSIWALSLPSSLPGGLLTRSYWPVVPRGYNLFFSLLYFDLGFFRFMLLLLWLLSVPILLCVIIYFTGEISLTCILMVFLLNNRGLITYTHVGFSFQWCVLYCTSCISLHVTVVCCYVVMFVVFCLLCIVCCVLFFVLLFFCFY